MKKYISIWLFITTYLIFEYWALSRHSSLSLLLRMQTAGLIHAETKISTVPGRALSLWLGYFGFSLMVLMNLYSVRKRFSFTQKWGSLTSWLNFHIFCGILGPTFILFHCNLKARGLVGISFWSMVVSFSSGIIGRYFFTQILRRKSDYEKSAAQQLVALEKFLTSAQVELTPEFKTSALNESLEFVGGYPGQSEINPLTAFFSSIAADSKMLFVDLPVPVGWPLISKYRLKNYAINKRRSQFLSAYQRLMGYWHAFHFPFAVFMYISAVIHIISSLIFVKF